jgi:hypothetical protein
LTISKKKKRNPLTPLIICSDYEGIFSFISGSGPRTIYFNSSLRFVPYKASTPPESRPRSPSSTSLQAARGRRRLAKPGGEARHQIRTLLVRPGPIPRLLSYTKFLIRQPTREIPYSTDSFKHSSPELVWNLLYLLGLKILVSYVSQAAVVAEVAFLVQVLVLG